MKTTAKIKAFLKNNVFSLICLLLCVCVLITGSLSYAKYISSDSAASGSGVGSFYVSASVDGVSGLSFTDTNFWSISSTEEEHIAMNALRSLKFSVNNFETDGDGNKNISAVKLKYALTFSAPQTFIQKLAMQVFDGEGEAVLPQIIIADMLNSAGGVYKTADSADYNGTAAEELEFSVVKNSDTFYTAKAGNTVITLEEYEKHVSQNLLFRMWDTAALNEAELDQEGGKVLPPLEVTFSETVKFYRISIMTEKFALPAGEATTDSYTVKLAPTESVSDGHMGASFVDANADSSGNITESESKLRRIYGGTGEVWYLKSLHGEHYYTLVIDELKWSQTGEDGKAEALVITKDNALEFYGDGIQKLHLSQCYSKSYPFFVNVVFEQAQ